MVKRSHSSATSVLKSSDGGGQSRSLAQSVTWLPAGALTPFPGNPRVHPEAQIAALMRAIKRRWTNPVLIDETNTILCGHGRVEAAKRLGLARVPTLILAGLSSAEKRAIVISDNKIGERSVWDNDLLKLHFKELIELDFDVELTGFSTGEVDLVLEGGAPKSRSDPDDDLTDVELDAEPITQLGDLWELGSHRLLCADARASESYRQLLGDERAQMIVTDAPYNVKISGHARGRGKTQHREFAMASGEMSDARFGEFLETVMSRAVAFSVDGSIHYWFMDWRHLPILLKAATPLYSDWKNLLVWRKSNAGQGSFYRSQHELIAVFKAGNAAHINNFGLGSNGRYRTNVLDYAGGSSLSAKRKEEMDIHPTVKPVALIADLIRDCSHRNGLILDPFGGSGTAILAAERSGRIARVIEIDPVYVDVSIDRWQRSTDATAMHAATGKTFAKLKVERLRSRDQTKALAEAGA